MACHEPAQAVGPAQTPEHHQKENNKTMLERLSSLR